MQLQCGNANGTGGINIADVSFLIDFVFMNGPAPGVEGECDGLAGINMLDIVYLVNYLFAVDQRRSAPGLSLSARARPIRTLC